MKKFLTVVFTLIFLMSIVDVVVAQKVPWVIPAKYKTMKSPNASNAKSIALGSTLYKQKCKKCHGSVGKGDGPMAGDLTKMDDLSKPEFKALPEGSRYFMSFVGRGDMPNFEKSIVEEEERWAIIDYINSL